MTEQPLKRDLENVIASRAYGGPFTAEHVTSTLLRLVDLTPKYSREMMYWSIVSALNRYDYDCVRRYVRMWSASPVEPSVWDVSKYIPGDHYHVKAAGVKFDTLDEAIEFIRKSGAVFGRLWEKFVYKDGN